MKAIAIAVVMLGISSSAYAVPCSSISNEVNCIGSSACTWAVNQSHKGRCQPTKVAASPIRPTFSCANIYNEVNCLANSCTWMVDIQHNARCRPLR